MPTRHRPPEPAQQSDSKQSHACAFPRGIAGTTTANCPGYMQCSNLANFHHSVAQYGLRQRRLRCVLAEGTPRIVHVHVESHIAVLFPIQLCDTPAEIGPWHHSRIIKTAQRSAGRLLQIIVEKFFSPPAPPLPAGARTLRPSRRPDIITKTALPDGPASEYIFTYYHTTRKKTDIADKFKHPLKICHAFYEGYPPYSPRRYAPPPDPMSIRSRAARQ